MFVGHLGYPRMIFKGAGEPSTRILLEVLEVLASTHEHKDQRVSSPVLFLGKAPCNTGNKEEDQQLI